MKKEKPQGRTTANLSTLERPENVPVKPSVNDVATIASFIMAGVDSAGFSGKKLLASEMSMLRSTIEGVEDSDWDSVGELSASQVARIKELWQAGAIEEARAAGIADTCPSPGAWAVGVLPLYTLPMKHFSTHSLFHPMLTGVVLATLVACHKKPSFDGTPPSQQTIHHEVIILMPPQSGKTVISSGTGQPPPKEVSTCP